MGMNELSLVILAVVALVVWLKWPQKSQGKRTRASSSDADGVGSQRSKRPSSMRPSANPSGKLPKNSEDAANLEFNPVRDLSLIQKNGANPLAEAVTLMKYGRTQQAVDVLQIAFRADPPSLEVGLKLAEVLLSTNDIKGYLKVEARFIRITKKEGPFWEALKILRADYMGGDDHSSASVYKDFSSTEISNHGQPLTGFSSSKLSPASRM